MGRSLILKHQSFSHTVLVTVSLCGISTPFGALSRSPRQISYVLLTRAPLSTSRRKFPVRLACVRHAASVHPEPGSNSPSNCWGLFRLSVLTALLLKCFLLRASCRSLATFCPAVQTRIPTYPHPCQPFLFTFFESLKTPFGIFGLSDGCGGWFVFGFYDLRPFSLQFT